LVGFFFHSPASVAFGFELSRRRNRDFVAKTMGTIASVVGTAKAYWVQFLAGKQEQRLAAKSRNFC
jgi:hypothetical protein